MIRAERSTEPAQGSSFGDARYRTVKGILSRGLDEQPTPEQTCCSTGALLHGIDAFAIEADVREE